MMMFQVENRKVIRVSVCLWSVFLWMGTVLDGMWFDIYKRWHATGLFLIRTAINEQH